jgi:hypothetical protein
MKTLLKVLLNLNRAGDLIGEINLFKNQNML